MDYVSFIILSIIEGFTEFLPISSTGHLIIAARFLGIPSDGFVKSFQIAIQLGAISAVVVLYVRRLLNYAMLKKLFIGFVPTGIIGFILYGTVRNVFLNSTTVVLWALFLGGIALIVFECLHKEKPEAIFSVDQISHQQAFFIGLFQSVAIIPGVSRSAATIVGGLALGLSRTTIVEFSFLLAIPTLVAATGLDMLTNYSSLSGNLGYLALGLVISFITAMISIKFLLRYIKTHTFTTFALYRIGIALLFWILL